jgi:hypothetical protein
MRFGLAQASGRVALLIHPTPHIDITSAAASTG